MSNYDLEHTFVTSDHHFCLWKKRYGRLLEETSVVGDERHIELWNSVVGKEDLVLYIGDICDGDESDLKTINALLNGRKILNRFSIFFAAKGWNVPFADFFL